MYSEAAPKPHATRHTRISSVSTPPAHVGYPIPPSSACVGPLVTQSQFLENVFYSRHINLQGTLTLTLTLTLSQTRRLLLTLSLTQLQFPFPNPNLNPNPNPIPNPNPNPNPNTNPAPNAPRHHPRRHRRYQARRKQFTLDPTLNPNPQRIPSEGEAESLIEKFKAHPTPLRPHAPMPPYPYAPRLRHI